MLDTLRETTRRIKELKKAKDLCINRDNVYSAELDDCIIPVLREMAKRSFTVVPVLKNGAVFGAFSENTLLTYLIENEMTGFKEGNTLRVVEHLLPIENHGSESFKFVKEALPALSIAKMFSETNNNQNRLGMIFVTKYGGEEEALLGILLASA